MKKALNSKIDSSLEDVQLLTLEDVAQYLGVTKQTVVRRHAKKPIPGGIKFDKQLRFVKKLFLEWIKSNAAH